MGFLPTLQVERLGFSTATAAIVTGPGDRVNVAGNLAAGWLLQRGVPRVAIIAGAAMSMAFCAAASSSTACPTSWRLVLAGVYSAVIGVVPGALFTACRAFAAARAGGRLDRSALQGSNIGGLIGPPISGALVASGGWRALHG